MEQSSPQPANGVLTRKIIGFAANVFLMLLAIALGLGVLEIVFRLQPRLLPIDIPSYPPARRFTSNQDRWMDVRRSDGDLFGRMEGFVKPLDPADDRLLDRMHLVTDRFGLRNVEPLQNRYDIVALGDSFTYGTSVSMPWPQRLGEIVHQSALNLGWEGVGPLEERDLFEQYGQDKKPRWVIVAFFEGNDLNDTASYTRADPLLVWRFLRYYVKQAVQIVSPNSVAPSRPTSTPPPSEYLYPLAMRVGKSQQDETLFTFYLSWLTAQRQAIQSSRQWTLIRAAWRTIRARLTGTESHLLIVYVPTKEHLLLLKNRDPLIVRRIFQTVPSVVTDSSGFLTQGKDMANPDTVLEHIDDQAQSIGALASDLELDFLDLSSCFIYRMEQGDRLYYEYDTHWNQSGHDLAAEMIAEYLRTGKAGCR